MDGNNYQVQPIAYHEFSQVIINLLTNKKNFSFSENLFSAYGIIANRNTLVQDLKKTENLCLNSKLLIECKNYINVIDKSLDDIFMTLFFSRNIN